jgi:hypothetical protein
MSVDHNRTAAQAEKLSNRRARALPVLAIMFLLQQGTYFTGGGAGNRTVDHVHIAAWLVLSVVLLLAMSTGGGWIYSREVRQLANDEATRVHRDTAFRLAFLVSMGACVLLYAISLYEPLGGRDALHAILTAGIATALIRFGFLERRALRDG